jgi:hypothetical protein
VFLNGAAFAIVGGLIVWFFIPDKERDLEAEDARFKAYLEENGFDMRCYGEGQVRQPRIIA